MKSAKKIRNAHNHHAKHAHQTAKHARRTTTHAHKHVRVLACGTFDIIHPGHIHFLQHAKKLGDELVVIVARDVNVQRIKHAKPIMHERARVQVVSQLKCVDRAVLGNEKGSMYVKVKEMAPDILVLGYDQWAKAEKVREEFAKNHIDAKVVCLKPFKEKEFKSNLIKQRIKNA